MGRFTSLLKLGEIKGKRDASLLVDLWCNADGPGAYCHLRTLPCQAD